VGSIIALAALLRVFYANDLTLTGDEVGVGVLQATGQAFEYVNRLPVTTAPISDFQSFVQYSNDYSLHDVLKSLRFAGMHPPLYYMILHVILKFMGNDVMILRGLSILFSLVSTLLIYQLGKIIFNKQAGMWAALLFAVSGYGLVYGTLVRPYPLAMVLALLSTLQLLKMNRDDKIHLKNPGLYLYGFTLVLGLYTIYHFFFVLVFQFIYMLFDMKKIKQHILPALALASFILIGYIPWLGSLWDQMKVVSGSQLYFHGPFRPIVITENILWIHLDTIRWLSIDPLIARIIVKLILGSAILIPVLMGCFLTIREKENPRLIMAVTASFLVYGGVETLMNMNTLEDLHLLFFAIPLMFIFMAKGITHFPNRFRFRFISITLILALFSGNSIAAIASHPIRSRGQHFETVCDEINTSCDQNSKNLLLINTAQRRYLFPMAHAIQVPLDLKIIQKNELDSSFILSNQVDQYDLIFFANFYIKYEKKTYLNDESVERLTNQLLQMTYQLKKTIITKKSNKDTPHNRLMIFERIKNNGNP